MLQILSLALFATVMIVSIMAIVTTVKAELPHILRALGVDPSPLPPLRSARAPRVRVTRRLRAAGQSALRAAA